MRIGLVSPYSWTVPGGVNDHVAHLANQLEARGHEPWIIAPAGSLVRRSSVVPIPQRFISAGTAVPFRSNGSRAYVNTWPLMLQRMERLLKNHPFDLLHAHEPTVPSVAASAVLISAIPVVGTFHAAGDGKPPYVGVLRRLADRIVSSLAVRIAVSEAAREYVGQFYTGDYKIVPNGVCIEDYLPARSGQKVPGRILFIGRAEPRKGLHILLQAFQQVRRALPWATLVLVGPSLPELRSCATRTWSYTSPLPLAGVTALGRLAHWDKVAEMAAAEVMCVPSLQGESFGLVLTEAMAAGVPLVASDLPGYRSVLRDGDLGRLVAAGDVDAMASELMHVLRDAGLRKELASSGIQAADDYAWTRVVDCILEAYEQALETAPQLSPNREPFRLSLVLRPRTVRPSPEASRM